MPGPVWLASAVKMLLATVTPAPPGWVLPISNPSPLNDDVPLTTFPSITPTTPPGVLSAPLASPNEQATGSLMNRLLVTVPPLRAITPAKLALASTFPVTVTFVHDQS